MSSLPIHEIGPDDGLLRMEVSSIRGSDYEQCNGDFSRLVSMIPGHEPVDWIEALGDGVRQRW